MQTATAVARSHIGPLGLLELTVVIVALIAGWKLVALAVLGLHLARMGFVAFRASRSA